MPPTKPRLPDLTGVLLVDKPSGPTSFDIIRVVKRLAQTKSAGHTGTLDPLATGLLTVCLGDATRIVQFLQDGEKEYEGVVRFGITTDTYDAEGRITDSREMEAKSLTREQVEQVVGNLVGVRDQVPPMYSAIKKDGVRLYELAREGIEVDRDARQIVVSEARLLDWTPPDATILVRCSKGTYIRSIAMSLGEELGTGAHLAALRRTGSGALHVRDAVSLRALEDDVAERGRKAVVARLVSVETALTDLAEIKLDSRRAASVAYGNALDAAALATLQTPALPRGRRVRLTGPDGLVVAVGESDGAGQVKLVRVLRPRSGPGRSEA